MQTGPMLLVYAYHSLDYPSPYKTLHEKQGWKTVTLLHEDSGTTTTSTATLKPTSLPTHVATKTGTIQEVKSHFVCLSARDQVRKYHWSFRFLLIRGKWCGTLTTATIFVRAADFPD